MTQFITNTSVSDVILLCHTFEYKSRRRLVYLNDASPYGDMMHLLRKYDVAPFGRNDAMFAPCAVRHTSIVQRTSLGEAVIICRRQTSFKKRTFVTRQKCVFCCEETRKRCVEVGKSAKKVRKVGKLVLKAYVRSREVNPKALSFF